jgi:hypothetical protein
MLAAEGDIEFDFLNAIMKKYHWSRAVVFLSSSVTIWLNLRLYLYEGNVDYEDKYKNYAQILHSTRLEA